MEEIYYFDGSQGPVFATKSQAERVGQIQDAMETATTWGEYRSLLPEGEWEEHGETFPLLDENGDPVVNDGTPVVEYLEGQEDDAPFDAETVPGAADGDYPVWLQQAMLDWMPQSILSKYGTDYGTRISGDSVQFESKDLDAIIEDLRALGHTVTESERELI